MKNEMNNKITYHQEGDYLIPDVKLPEENPKYKNKTIGKYGTLRLNYIKEYKKGRNALDWVCAMNNAQSRAEEIVYKEIIYV